MNPRTVAFVSVGLFGFLVQTMVLAVLSLAAHWSLVVAMPVAVEAAVLTNFLWHERWTWHDRVQASRRWSRLLRFHITNGITSLTGNTVVTVLLAAVFGLNPIAGNVVAVGLTSALNYLAADRWVFVKRATAAFAILVIAFPSAARAAELTPGAVAAWSKYVSATEAALAQHEHDRPLAEPQGRTIAVDGATIHEWRGSRTRSRRHRQSGRRRLARRRRQAGGCRRIAATRATWRLDACLSETRASRDRHRDMTPSTTCSMRRSPVFATSCSVATKIVETGGADRGFLWRLNFIGATGRSGTTCKLICCRCHSAATSRGW